MSVYSTATEAYRDTTKWLVALVPLGSIAAFGALVAPRLVQAESVSTSWTSWCSTFWGALLGCLLILLGIWLIVKAGSSVLSSEPTDFDKIIENQDRLNEAFGAGAGIPYFIESGEFRTAVLDLHSGTLANTLAKRDSAVAATAQLLEWVYFDSIRRVFGSFRCRFVISLVLIFGGLALAASTLSGVSAPFSRPTVVSVELSSRGSINLAYSTGCRDPRVTEFVAISGTWSTPVLEVEGPGCRIGARWRPSANEAQVEPIFRH